MKHNFGTLTIEKVIIHDIPQHRAGEEGIKPILSEVESNLTQELKNYFKERINGSISSSSAFDVVFSPDTTSPMPQLVCNCTNGNAQEFVKTSQNIATHLFKMQSGINSKGLLSVIFCKVDGRHSLAILKLEREEGVRLKTTTLAGKQTYDLDLIKELMLTGKTKLFKLGLFVQSGKAIETIEGVVCDYQKFAKNTEIADFFLSKFLGCRLTLVADICTKKFFNVTEQFCNEEVPNPLIRGEYLTHLFSELTSQKNTINPRIFASENLEEADRNKYLNYLEEHQTPITAFSKDIDLVESRIKTMSLQFQSGATILAPNDVFQEKVHITQLDSGDTRAEIVDKVKHMGSR